jgi:hypothetical protein
MAENVKLRTPPLNPLPPGKAFAPHGVNEEARSKDREAVEAATIEGDKLSAFNPQKVAYSEVTAQDGERVDARAILLSVSSIFWHSSSDKYIPAEPATRPRKI